MKKMIDNCKKKLDLIANKEFDNIKKEKSKVKDFSSKLKYWKILSNIEPMVKNFTDCINNELDKRIDMPKEQKDDIGKELVKYSQNLVHKFTALMKD
jgi:hypothetical protein